MAKNALSRRGLLGAFATTTGGLILGSLATGIPASVLLDPLSAKADEGSAPARMLILSSSRNGDPLNANVPGTYGPSDIYHSPDLLMEETPMTLGGVETSAAKPWADLLPSTLARTCFFHHATYTPVHGELPRVQRMMDATERNDMLVSLLAKELAPRLGTVQSDPVSLGADSGGELLSASGRILGNVAPLSVRGALGGVDGPLKGLTALRDQHIDRIYDLYRQHGTPSQKTLLDAWVRSRDEVRSISSSLLSRLEVIDGNDQVNQVRTAAILAAMKIAPIITVHLDFGGDNHSDPDFERETAGHLASIPTLQLLMDELDSLAGEGNLQNEVIVATLNVFGRTLKQKGTTGRDHESGHHVMVLMGNGIASGVVGGVEPTADGKGYLAQSIDSTTGAGGAGDIPYEETLGAAGKTLGVALGVSRERMDEILPVGKVVESALA
jgi:hypothetical protein